MMQPKRGNEMKKSSQRKEKSGHSKKEDVKSFIGGWNLPFLQDENDIVNWMKREKNGDNKKKPRRDEEVPEEQYRHVVFSRCINLDNEMEFERESLHERYRKHCQYGPKPADSSNRGQTSTTTFKEVKDVVLEDEEVSERHVRYPRSCKSADISSAKVSSLRDVGLTNRDIETLSPSVLTRSHSVIADSQLKAYGLTLPPDQKTARLMELAHKFILKANGDGKTEAEPEDGGVDEGYDSKVSSNDNEVPDDDPAVSKVGHCDSESVYTNLDSLVQMPGVTADDVSEGVALSSAPWEESAGDPGTDRPQMAPREGNAKTICVASKAETTPVADHPKYSIAKLIYSRRDRNFYERPPSKRSSSSTFRYAGKEQSRLMEMSLNHITPGYLNTQQFARLTACAQPVNCHGNGEGSGPPSHHHHPQQQQNHTHLNRQPVEQDSLQPRALVLRKISLQNANPSEDAFVSSDPSEDIRETQTQQSTAKDEPPPQTSSNHVAQVPVPASNGATFTHADDADKEKDQPTTEPSPLICVHDLSTTVVLPNRTHTVACSSDRQYQHMLTVDNTVVHVTHLHTNGQDNRLPSPGPRAKSDLANGMAALLKYHHAHSPTSQGSESFKGKAGEDVSGLDHFKSDDNSGHGFEKLASTTYLPVADLLPAVERNLRRRKAKGLTKQQQLYRSYTMEAAGPWRREGGQGLEASLDSSQLVDANSLAAALDARLDRKSYKRGGQLASMKGNNNNNNNSLLTKSHGPPAFRPHHALSPLQRAKEIVNRRMHGHVTQLPDGSEAVRVSSPQYQMPQLDRANSASRQLNQMINDYWKRL